MFFGDQETTTQARVIDLGNLGEVMRGYEKLCKIWPEINPKYTRRQREWLRRSAYDMAFYGYVKPFSPQEYEELMLDVGFWLQETLYAHYWEQDRSLTWEEFLSLTKGRKDIKSAAGIVLGLLNYVCRPDLDIFDHWDVLRAPNASGGYDYASRKDLTPQGGKLPLIVPKKELDLAVDTMVREFESALFIKKKTEHRHLLWQEFKAALEADPALVDALAQRVRWLFSMNLHNLKKLWECGVVEIPPLRAN